MFKFKKTVLGTGPCFISDCGNYKVVNYGGAIFAYKKIKQIHTYGENKGKIYWSFGDSIEKSPENKSKKYKTYREAFKAVEKAV